MERGLILASYRGHFSIPRPLGVDIYAWRMLRDQEHTKLPLKAESLYPTMAGRLNATAAFQAPAFLCRKV
jgi:hypothetical protein